MTDGSEKRNRLLASDLQNSHVCQKRSNDTLKQENLVVDFVSNSAMSL